MDEQTHEMMLEPELLPMTAYYDHGATPLDVMVPVALRSLCFVLSLRALYQWLVRTYPNQQGPERYDRLRKYLNCSAVPLGVVISAHSSTPRSSLLAGLLLLACG